MKKATKVVCLLSLLLALVSVAGVPGPNGTFRLTFSWDVPTDPASLIWRLYGTTNAALPTNQWTFISLIAPSNTVQTAGRLYYTNYVVPGDWFFTMTASNAAGFWGTSFFSSAAETPPAPPVLNNLQLNP